MADVTNTEYKPRSVSHPGQIVLEYIDFNGWSQRDLARRTGITPKTISEICGGKAPIMPQTALALEKVFQRPAHFWLNLQRQYDEAEARRRMLVAASGWQNWASRFPVNEMKRYGWINAKTPTDAVNALLTFFGVSSPEGWQSVWDAYRVAYRQTRRFQLSPEAVSAWSRATEIAASQFKTKEFDEVRLRSILDELRHLTREPAERFVPIVQELCANAGVAVVWVPELAHTGISGCARWITNRKALIGITLRYKTDDEIWFTFFHELAHILLHYKEYGFILDNADRELVDNVVDPHMQKKEEEANRFAEDTLIPPSKLHPFMKSGNFSTRAVHGFADDLGIGPGIVVGRLQREGVLARYQGNTLKRIFNWTIRHR